jgi:hypothetical protein
VFRIGCKRRIFRHQVIFSAPVYQLYPSLTLQTSRTGNFAKAAPKTSEQRQDHRQRVLKGASILAGIASSQLKCTVGSMHADSAELKVEIDARVPTEFLLYVPLDGVAYRRSSAGSRKDVSA